MQLIESTERHVPNCIRHGAQYAEYTAMAAALAVRAVLPEVGGGDKDLVDELAVQALVEYLSGQPHRVRNVNCEGVKDEAAYLEHGKIYGLGSANLIGEVTCDPVENTGNTAAGKPGGRSLFGIVLGANNEVMPELGLRYMEKVSVHPELAGRLDLSWRLSSDPRDHVQGARGTVKRIAVNAGVPTSEVRVFVLNRDRNQHIMDGLRRLTDRIVPIVSGDFAVVEKSMIASPKQPIVLMGSGGVPEGVLSAMINPVGFQGVLIADSDREQELLESDHPLIARYGGRVLDREAMLGNKVAVLSVGSITGDNFCGYDRPFESGGHTHVQVRTHISNPDQGHVINSIVNTDLRTTRNTGHAIAS